MAVPEYKKMEHVVVNMEPFGGAAEEFEYYFERMEPVSQVNSVEKNMKVSMFITFAGTV